MACIYFIFLSQRLGADGVGLRTYIHALYIRIQKNINRVKSAMELQTYFPIIRSFSVHRMFFCAHVHLLGKMLISPLCNWHILIVAPNII